MYSPNLIVLSYHQFTENQEQYQYSRTLSDFAADLGSIKYDWVTIDDGRVSIMEACRIMRKRNIRAKLFICTSLVGLDGYCTWNDLGKLSAHHDIENHSHIHKKHTEMEYGDAISSIQQAQSEIEKELLVIPRYFVPPYNTFTSKIEVAALKLGLQLVKNRITILNDTVVHADGLMENIIVGSGPKGDIKLSAI